VLGESSFSAPIGDASQEQKNTSGMSGERPARGESVSFGAVAVNWESQKVRKSGLQLFQPNTLLEATVLLTSPEGTAFETGLRFFMVSLQWLPVNVGTISYIKPRLVPSTYFRTIRLSPSDKIVMPARRNSVRWLPQRVKWAHVITFVIHTERAVSNGYTL
jgi:hypothetical protein